ncbi:MAG: hypothetical protein ACK48R_15640 [Planctomyces sp.]
MGGVWCVWWGLCVRDLRVSGGYRQKLPGVVCRLSGFGSEVLESGASP